MAYIPYNLEKDLKTSTWIVNKVKENDTYAQNLYAALCNNEFVKNEILPILKEEFWSCSWRYAGELIAEIKGSGDYLDYYCTGLTNATYDTVQDAKIFHNKLHMSEGEISDEVRTDLLNLGWMIIT